MAELSTQENENDRPKSAEKSKEKKEKSRPLTKVVIRRLPPTMSEETFLEQISPIPDHDYFYFVNADRTLGLHSFCRAYINFANATDIFNFKEKFDNYVFVDNRGNEFPAVVEYAPYQGVPKKKSRKNDPKCGTIETDPHYLEFLESLKVDENEVSKDKTEFTYQVKDDKKTTTTPLLEYLAARKMEKQRIKAERKEERRKKELERKKLRDEERRRRKIEFSKSKHNVIDEETYVEGSAIKETESDIVKSKSQDYDDRVSKYKGKSFRDKRSEEYSRRTDEKKIDMKAKIREDRRYNDGDHLRRSEYKSSYSRTKVKEDDRKNEYHRSDARETKKEVRNEVDKPEKKFEVKKYSEARKEREARRNELRKLAKKNSDTDLNPATSEQEESKKAHVADTLDIEKTYNSVDDDKNSVGSPDNGGDKLVEDEKIDDLVVGVASINCGENSCNDNIENENENTISKINCRKYSNTEDKPCDDEKEINDKMDQKSIKEKSSESKKYCSGKKSLEDRKDPRTERRIRNKDRPSMAIYQPGKARLNQSKEKSSNDEEKTSN